MPGPVADFGVAHAASYATDPAVDRLGTVLAAAPELKTRPNLAVAALKAPGDPRVNGQVMAHASNMMSLAQAFSEMAGQSGGEEALHEQLASQSARYSNALSSIITRVLGTGGTPAPGANVTPGPRPALYEGPTTPFGELARVADRLFTNVTEGASQPAQPSWNPKVGQVVHMQPYNARTAKLPVVSDMYVRTDASGRVVDVNRLTTSTSADVAGITRMAAGALNAPLREVQHQYRYLHDVEANHGPAAAGLAALGLLAGGVAGYFGGGARGAVLGAEGAGEVEGHILYPSSWHAAADPNYRDPHTGRPVSLGRDFASTVGLQPGSAPFTVVSGLGDAIGDMTLDPVANAGGIFAQARSLAGAKGLLGSRFSGTAVTADTIDRVYDQYPSVRRAFGQIADSTPAEIAVRFPNLNVALRGADGNPVTSGFIQALGRARTADEVRDVMKSALRAQDLTGGFRAPTLSLTRKSLQTAANQLQDWAAAPARTDSSADAFLAQAKAQRSRLLARVVDSTFRSQTRVAEDWDPELMRYESRSLDLMGQTAPRSLYLILRQGEDHNAAMATVARFVSSPDPGERVAIWRNALSDLLLARAARSATVRGGQMVSVGSEAAFADPEIIQKVSEAAKAMSSQGLEGGTYGATDTGAELEPLVDEADPKHTFQAGLLSNHTGRVSVPTFSQIRRAGQMLAGGHALFGRADDFLYEAVTNRIFKRAVLLSLSFAEHIVAGEMLQSALRLGPVNMARDIVTSVGARLGYEFEKNPDEAGIIAQTAAAIMRKTDPERYAIASALLMRHGTHYVSSGIAAGHHIADEVKSVESWRDLLADLRSSAPRNLTTGRYGLQGYDPGGAQDDAWASWLAEGARDPATQEAAGAYAAAKRVGMSEADATAQAVTETKAWLDLADPRYLAQMARHSNRTQTGIDMGLSPHEDWARNVVANLKGMVTGMNGTRHDFLLDHIANGEPAFDPANLAQLAPNEHPALVKGSITKPYVSGRLERIATAGHRKVLSPFINTLSRDPTYIEEVTRQMRALQPLMDEGMGFDEALNAAETRATQHMIRYVHNIGERTQLSELARNVAPFFFAQQQAYKRLGRLLAENPGAFRQYQLGLQALQNISSTHTDAQGNAVVAYPGIGNLTSGMLQGFSAIGWAPNAPVPVKWNGSLSSAAVIAPFATGMAGMRPDLGPVVQIPLAAVKMTFPELSRLGVSADAVQSGKNAIDAILGPISAQAATPSKVWSMLVPNVLVQRLLEATDPTLLNEYYSSAAHQMIAMIDYEQNLAMRRWEEGGRKGPEPQLMPSPIMEKSGAMTTAQVDFLNRVKNGTRIIAGLKALVGFATPLSPQISFDKWGLSGDLKAYIQGTKAGTSGLDSFAKAYVKAHPNGSGLGQGVTDFLLDHPDATPFTVWSAKTAAGGAEVPATAKAMKWANQNRDFIKKYPDAAFFLLPPSDSTDTFSQTVYNDQLSQALRQRQSDPQFLNSVYVAEGDHQYFNVLRPAYEAAKVKMAHPDWSAQQAIDFANDPKNSAALLAIKTPPALAQRFDQMIATLAAQNPAWAKDFTGNRSITAQTSYEQLKAALNDPHLPPSPITDSLRTLVKGYEQVAANLPVGTSSYASSQQVKVQRVWREWLDTVRIDHPELANVISAVFYNLGGGTSGS